MQNGDAANGTSAGIEVALLTRAPSASTLPSELVGGTAQPTTTKRNVGEEMVQKRLRLLTKKIVSRAGVILGSATSRSDPPCFRSNSNASGDTSPRRSRHSMLIKWLPSPLFLRSRHPSASWKRSPRHSKWASTVCGAPTPADISDLVQVIAAEQEEQRKGHADEADQRVEAAKAAAVEEYKVRLACAWTTGRS